MSRRTVLEEVNHNDITMEPLHYPVVAPLSEELLPMAWDSAVGQICAAEGVTE